jgi:hypothetical protein
LKARKASLNFLNKEDLFTDRSKYDTILSNADLISELVGQRQWLASGPLLSLPLLLFDIPPNERDIQSQKSRF